MTTWMTLNSSEGIATAILSGDSAPAVRDVAERLGIDDWSARQTPEMKLAQLEERRAAGALVLMVGDGVNDAPALAQADVGIAIGAGTDVAKETGDIVLIRNDPGDVASAVELGRATLGKIRQNLFWAFAYNVAAIPAAMAGLLNPFVAGAALAFSSVFVVTNSLRLRRFRGVSVAGS